MHGAAGAAKLKRDLTSGLAGGGKSAELIFTFGGPESHRETIREPENRTSGRPGRPKASTAPPSPTLTPSMDACPRVGRVAAKLESHGRIPRGYLGLGLRLVAIEGGGSGAMVMNVDPRGPGATAGIYQGDIVMEWPTGPRHRGPGAGRSDLVNALTSQIVFLSHLRVAIVSAV
jgi:hypothetical protein